MSDFEATIICERKKKQTEAEVNGYNSRFRYILHGASMISDQAVARSIEATLLFG